MRYLLLLGTLGLLLIPRSIWSPIYALILVGPIVITGVLRRQDRTFLYWSAFVSSFLLFAYVRDIADAVGPGPFVNYPILLDRILALGTVPTVSLQSAWYAPGAPRWWDYAGIIVYLTHYLSLPLGAMFVWWLRPRLLRPYLLGASLMFIVEALLFVLVPTAPPWIAAQTGHLPTVYRPLVDILDGAMPGVYQYGLSIAGGNPVAAMPSNHMAVAVLLALAIRRTRLATLGLIYAVAMGITLVYFGEHYVVDLLAGAVLAILSWRLFGGDCSVSGDRD